MKNIIMIMVLTIGLINAQGITNTLGGNTENDKFIVENKDAETGLVVTGEGNVGIGTLTPKSKLSLGGDGNSNIMIYCESSKDDNPVIKSVSSSGLYGIGVSGVSEADNGKGISGKANGAGGIGTFGSTTASSGTGTKGYGTGEYSYGLHGVSTGNNGKAVFGQATATSGQNYGGLFRSESPSGFGVYGLSPKYGVYGTATASSGLHYGGFFETENPSGRGIYATSSTSTGSAYGGVFEASNSPDGIGVYANGKKYDFHAAGAGVDYHSASSRRWKNNIIEIDEPLEKLSQLRGIYFNWDEEHGGKHDMGCIAEEIGKVLPEIVVYEDNGIDANGMDYSKLTPLLIEAIKALQKRVEELESR